MRLTRKPRLFVSHARRTAGASAMLLALAPQLAGAQDLDALFEIEQPFTDALWTLIYGPRDPGPASTPPAPATAATP